MADAQPSIAVVGAGAVGLYYGARLAEAGRDVRFLLRSDYDAVEREGIRVESPRGDLVVESPSIARAAHDVGQVDWVICALKATAIDDARALVEPLVGEDTRVLLLMNGLGLEERFAAWMPRERIFAGLAFTCLNRVAPGVVHHLDYGAITLAHFADDSGELEAAKRFWDGAKVEIQTAPSLLAARWTKLLWNVPFNGLAVTAGGITTDRVMADPGLRAAAETLMREVVAIGNADLEAHGEAARLNGASAIPAMLTATAAMAVYRPSTMIDFVEGRPLEVDAIFGEPLRRADALGVPAPGLTIVEALMRALDPGRR